MYIPNFSILQRNWDFFIGISLNVVNSRFAAGTPNKA